MSDVYQKDSSGWTIVDYTKLQAGRNGNGSAHIVTCQACKRGNGLQINKRGVLHMEKAMRDLRTGILNKQRLVYCAGGYDPPAEKKPEQTLMPWGSK